MSELGTRELPEVLYAGAHDPDGKMCLLEAVAYVAGESWSDHPACVSPSLAAYGRTLNDQLPDDQRQELRRFIPLLIGTARDPAVEYRLALFFADAAVRVFAPMALETARLVEEAAKLRALPEITDESAARSAEWSAARSAAIEVFEQAITLAWAESSLA